MKKLMGCIALMFSMFSSVGQAGEITAIHFATEATYPPFEYVDESGQIKGFDRDIANAICTEIKAKCTFTNQPFSSLIPSLKLGKFDALISALGITKERQQQVDFSTSYYEPSGSFIANSKKHMTLAGLSGKKVGVQSGSTFEKYLTEKYADKVTIKTYASIQDAFLDLGSDRIDVVLADTPIATSWLKLSDNNKNYSLVDKPVIDHDYFGAGYGVAVKKGNTLLLKTINDGLAAIKKNGTYARIAKTYFGE